MSDARNGELPRTLANLTIRHAPDIASLPEPPDEFIWSDTDVPMDILQRLAHRGALEQAATRRDRDDVDRSRYRVREKVHELAADYADGKETLPCCNSTGIINDGGTIRCKRCGEPVDRETARRVVA